ncbi:MAG TPA: FAD-dependent oxidoreductase [Tepidisphaeraceae bacterium]|jgi:NAD(P)H-nitrite reductase large subunit
MSDAHVQYLIVGGGVAGGTAVEAIRQVDPVGPMMLVGQEINRPYHRQQLSSDYLLDKLNHESLFLHTASWYAGHHVELRTGRAASHLDTVRQVVTLDDGSNISFDALLIATGATPRRLVTQGAELPNIYYPYTVEDADRLRHAILQSLNAGHRRACIIGGSLHAIDLAATLVQMGLQVDLVYSETHPLMPLAGESAGALIAHVLADRGVKLHRDARPPVFEGDGRVQRVNLDNAQAIATDLVIVAAGMLPSKQLVRTTAIRAETAILVDEHCSTNVPGIFAVGQCAAIFDPRFGKHRQFFDEANIAELGRLAGRNMTGIHEGFSAIASIERKVFDLDLFFAGESRLVHHRIVRTAGTEKRPSLIEFGLNADNCVTQITVVGPIVDRQILLELIRRRISVAGQEEGLKEPGFDLNTLL